VFTRRNSLGVEVPVQLAATAPFALPLSGLNTADSKISYDRIPYVLNAVNPNSMLIGLNGLYESIGTQGDTITDISAKLSMGGAHVSALAYGGMRFGSPNAALAYVALNDGTLWLRTTAGASFSRLASYPGSAVHSLVLDPADFGTVFVVDTTDVWVTHN